MVHAFHTTEGQREMFSKKLEHAERSYHVDRYSLNGCMCMGIHCNFGSEHFGTSMGQQKSNAAFLGVNCMIGLAQHE